MLNLSPNLKNAYLLKEKFMEFADACSFDEAKQKLSFAGRKVFLILLRFPTPMAIRKGSITR
jgi:hypothetical protein